MNSDAIRTPYQTLSSRFSILTCLIWNQGWRDRSVTGSWPVLQQNNMCHINDFDKIVQCCYFVILRLQYFVFKLHVWWIDLSLDKTADTPCLGGGHISIGIWSWSYFPMEKPQHNIVLSVLKADSLLSFLFESICSLDAALSHSLLFKYNSYFLLLDSMIYKLVGTILSRTNR